MPLLAHPATAIVVTLALSAAAADGWLNDNHRLAVVLWVVAALVAVIALVEAVRRHRKKQVSTSALSARVVNRPTGVMNVEDVEFEDSDRPDVDNWGDYKAKGVRHRSRPDSSRRRP